MSQVTLLVLAGEAWLSLAGLMSRLTCAGVLAGSCDQLLVGDIKMLSVYIHAASQAARHIAGLCSKRANEMTD